MYLHPKAGKREIIFVDPQANNHNSHSHANVPLYVSNSMQEDEPSGIGRSLFKVLNKVPGFELNTKGLYQSQVSVELKNYQWFEQWKDLRLTPSRTNALLADGWTIGGPQAVKDEIKYLIPIGTILNNLNIDSIMSIFEPLKIAREFAWVDFGKIEPDAVPCVHLAEFNNGQANTPDSCFDRMKKQLKDVQADYRP